MIKTTGFRVLIENDLLQTEWQLKGLYEFNNEEDYNKFVNNIYNSFEIFKKDNNDRVFVFPIARKYFDENGYML